MAPDADADEVPGSCEFVGECGSGYLCIEGECVEAPECESIDRWSNCAEAIEDEWGVEIARKASCDPDGYCRLNCWVDSECAPGQVCTDYGLCVEYDADLSGVAPGGDARKPIEVGLANTPLDIPLGVSAAGFGSRSRSSTNQYADELYPTAAIMHGLYARAIALDNGERQLLLVRLPTIFPSHQLHEAVARALQAETGADWRDSLILSSTHTHSGPGRFWPLPDDAAVPLGILGTDSFHQEIYERLRDSTIEAALAALDDREPARVGWTIFEAYDTDDLVASDRWGATPPFDDNRLLMMRFDDLEGVPRAALVSFGTHGTFFEETYLTGDAPGAVERGFEARLGEEYDRYVPTLFFSQNGGTMSPRGDRFGHSEVQKFEAHGAHFAGRAFDAFDAIETQTDVDLDARSHRFQITYDALGYEPEEWAPSSGRAVGNTLWHGGFTCIGEEDDDYSTHYIPFDFGCLPAHFISQNRPLTLFNKSLITALRIGDLHIVTLPGESSMELGYQVVREVNERLGVDWRDLFIWGYAQDHQLYLTPTNLRGDLPPFPGISTPMAMDDYPDFAFSWLQGGYEASLSVWGPAFGDYLAERAFEAAQMLVDGSPAPNASERVLPSYFRERPTQPFLIEDTPDASVGEVVIEMPEVVDRLSSYEFGFVGGDPGAEAPLAPKVRLVRVDGASDDVLTRSRALYTNFEPVMLTRVRTSAEGLFEWIVYWEELHDFPAGTYRFEVEGHYQSDGVRTPYTTSSRAFEVQPSELIEVAANLSGLQLEAVLSYPASEGLSFDRSPEDPGAVQGAFRMRHPEVPDGIPYPIDPGEDVDATGVEVRVFAGQALVATLSGQDLELTQQTRSVQGRNVPVTIVEATLSPGATRVEIDVVDAWGNTGTYPE